jgi:hypothetical protein
VKNESRDQRGAIFLPRAKPYSVILRALRALNPAIFRAPSFSARHAENDSFTRIKVFTGHYADVLSWKLVVKVIALLSARSAPTVTLSEVSNANEVEGISDSFYRDSANHSDSFGLARSLALSFSRVAAARRIPVPPHVLQRNSGFLARARHARGNDRKIRPSGRACHYLVQGSIRSLARFSCGRGQAARRLRVFATAVTRG